MSSDVPTFDFFKAARIELGELTPADNNRDGWTRMERLVLAQTIAMLAAAQELRLLRERRESP